MTFAPASSFGNGYVPTYRNYELDDDSLKMALARDYVTLAYAINIKTNGIFETVETQNGEQFFSLTTNQAKKRYVFRKCFTLDSIAAGSSLTVDHGIVSPQQFTSISGVCITDSPDYRTLPYSSVTANANIELLVTDTNFTVYNGAASPNIVSGTVILEYLKQ